MVYDNNNLMPGLQAMNLSNTFCPMMQMPQQQLEEMYPVTYNIVYPAILKSCDMLTANYGGMIEPNKEQLDVMVDNIYKEVEGQVENTVEVEGEESEERQFFFGGRRILRDFIGALLIRELLARRNPYYYNAFPGYYPYSGYNVYPGYYGAFPGYYGGGYVGY
ncbi:MAG: hypothetical protein N2645_13895 [Clostridia bacterium]|nr:hypothetical protein [Clostridia bacterium]